MGDGETSPIGPRHYDNPSCTHSGCADGPPPVWLQRVGLPGMDWSCLPQRERVETPSVLADLRYGRDQLDILPGSFARDGPRLGALHARGFRVPRESPADRDPRSTPRRGGRGGQGSARLPRADAAATRRRQAPPPPSAAPAAAPAPRADPPPPPR